MEIKKSIKFTTKVYNFLSGLGLPVSPIEFTQVVHVIEQVKPKDYNALGNVIIPIMSKNKEQYLLLQEIITFLIETSDEWEKMDNIFGLRRIDPLILRESAPTIAKLIDWISHPELFYKRLQELYIQLNARYGDRILNSGYMFLSEALELDKPEKELIALSRALELAGWCPEDIVKITTTIESMLMFVRRNISEFVINASRISGDISAVHGNEPRSGEKELWNIPLSFLSKKDIDTINQIIKRMAMRFREDLKRRQYGVPTRNVSVRQTFRLNTGRDMLIQLGYSKIKKLESPLIVLCDISGSMRNYARFFMQFISVVKDTFKKLRVFVFVSGVEDVTLLVKNKPADELIDRIFADYREARTYTDYGNTFRQFISKHLDLVTSKTRLLIIGDGRTNYQYPGDQELATLKKRVKDIFWFTPDENYAWFIGDSEMNLYSQYTDKLFVVKTLGELKTALQSLLTD
ncbi:MAG: VWA domain-containing protein [bacterium]